MEDVIVDDSVLKKAGYCIEQSADDFEKTLNNFCSVLEEVNNSGLVEGDTAKAFGIFTQSISKYKGMLRDQGTLIRVTLKDLVYSLDQEDGDLY